MYYTGASSIDANTVCYELVVAEGAATPVKYIGGIAYAVGTKT
jgi:hypothetical protein